MIFFKIPTKIAGSGRGWGGWALCVCVWGGGGGYLLAREYIPDAVAGQQQEAVAGLQLHAAHVRLRGDDLLRRRQRLIALVFEVPDGARQIQVAVHPRHAGNLRAAARN